MLFFSSETFYMKILQVCSYLYPALSYGGPAKMVYDLSLELSKNHEITIYTTDVWNEQRRIKQKEKLRSEERITIKYFPNFINKLAYRWRLFTGFGMVVDFIKNHQGYDVVHIHDVFIIPQLLIALLCNIYKIPYYYSPHGVLDPVRLEKKSVFKSALLSLVLFCLNNAQQVISVSKNEEADLRKLGSKNTTTVYNGIPKLVAKSTNKFKKYKSKSLTLLYIGKLHPQKGLREMLQAFLESKIEAQVLIAGPDDGVEAELKAFVRDNKLNTVHFLGFVTDSEKKELYKISDIFVHPSLAEGFSISILEAMQEKLPVLISDGCNFFNVKKFNAGYIVKVKNLVKNLTVLFKSLESEKFELKTMGINGANLIKKKYTVSKMAIEISRIYEKYI